MGCGASKKINPVLETTQTHRRRQAVIYDNDDDDDKTQMMRKTRMRKNTVGKWVPNVHPMEDPTTAKKVFQYQEEERQKVAAEQSKTQTTTTS